ncbi:RNA polymerase II-associated protein 1 domain containing protein [Aphelenchoides besseyi]|nr:RNA polymerase II-associated protein 1 domain containing protein [Aphelenchoides besseyi]
MKCEKFPGNKMSRRPKKVINTLKLGNPNRGRFNLETVEEAPNPPISHVQERLPGFFDYPERCQPYEFTVGCEGYATEDGFPEVLDLSAYFSSDSTKRTQKPQSQSIFAAEFDRLNGDLSKTSVPEPIQRSSTEESQPTTSYDQIERENDRRIAEMDDDEIRRALEEIHERLDPSTIEFLRRRAKQKKEKPTVSLFKQRSQNRNTESKTSEIPKKEEIKAAEFIRNLEVISDDVLEAEGLAEYSRLAMNPMHMDFASKYMKSVVPAQEKNLLRMFDKLRVPPNNQPVDPLEELARSRMDAICELYIEEFVTQQGKRERRFASDVNPLVTAGWSLTPVRRVLDANAKREANGIGITKEDKLKIVADDREMIELSLLWTVLLLRQQPTYFNLVHSVPGDIYCRVAEIYLLGPEIFQAEHVEKCVSIVLNEFLLPKAAQGHLSLKLTKSISGLDAFLPFYEDLLKRFLEFSFGDSHFTVFLLLAAYANSALGDALTIRSLLWSSGTVLVRQMTVGVDGMSQLLEYVNRNLEATTRLYATQFPDQFRFLLNSYNHAIQAETVTAERNPAVWKIAIDQLEAAKSIQFAS